MSASSMYLVNARTWVTQFPPVEWALRRAREVAIGALRQGPIPEHVAFVMDGNRRFARSRQIETIEGHNLGFEALARILEVCYRSGVRVVTIYAFSIENFHRSKHEVEGLMGLAKLKLTQLAAHGELLARYGARIKIIGQREMIRADVLEVVDRVEALTADNGDAILNVCFPYTSREEITSAVRGVVTQWATPKDPEKPRPFSASHISHHIRSRHLAASTTGISSTDTGAAGVTGSSTSASLDPQVPDAAVSSDPDSSSPSLDSATTLHPSPPSTHITSTTSTGPTHPATALSPSSTSTDPSTAAATSYPDPESIDVAALNAAMHTAGMPPLRLLVRTSGVARFSDFMLWQAHEETEVVFVPCMWPEFDLWRFLPILVEWQWRQRHEQRAVRKNSKRRKMLPTMSMPISMSMMKGNGVSTSKDDGDGVGEMDTKQDMVKSGKDA